MVHLLDCHVMFGSWIDWDLDIWRKLDGQYCAKEDKQRWRLDRLGRELHQMIKSTNRNHVLLLSLQISSCP